MTYFYAPKYSRHKWNTYSPCASYRSLWKLQLISQSWSFTKRVTMKGKYNRVRRYIRRKKHKWVNPLCHFYFSPAEKRIWGKFNR